MEKQEVGFVRTKTKSCSTGEVLGDEVTARVKYDSRQGAIVIAKIKWMDQPARFNNWRVEWTAHSVTQKDIEQVLSKLVELNEEKPHAGQ